MLERTRRSISSIRRRAHAVPPRRKARRHEAAQLDASILELEDSWEAINAWFLEHDLTDGLPIVPPTQARVAAMTDYVERALGWQPPT